MCGVIVVDAESIGLLVSYVIPICMIIALDIVMTLHGSINCSTVICSPTVILMLLREATSETYGPRVYSHHINLYHFIYLLCFYFAFYFLLCIYLSKIPKILSLSDLTFASYREGIDNPFIALVARFFFVCVGAWDF